MKKNILIIAYKYNDIFYSLNTEEYKNADKRTIILIKTKNVKNNKFPFLNKFDHIIELNYNNILTLSLEIIFRIHLKNIDTVILSNPVLLISQLLINKIQSPQIVLLEDGLMNYYNFIPSKSFKKKLMQKIFFISEQKILSLIHTTYLLDPSKAIFYFGKPQLLSLYRIDKINNNIIFINGKSLFVGQNLYDYGTLSIEEYNKLVNYFIQKYKIDYYIPHIYSSSNENIKCNKIDLNKYGVTLEMLSSEFKFNLYSFSSSVLYSTKLINPSIKTHLLKNEKISNPKLLSFLESYCDDIYSYN